MTEWKEYKLGEIATFSYGKLPNKILLGKGPYVVYSGYKYLEHYPEYNCNVGDVILVARGVGGTGDVKLVNRKCFLTNLSIKIDLDNDVILNEYFYYIYQIENLRYLDSGSAQSQITIQDLSNVAISLPPLSEQIRITSILSSLDDKIDLLHRENKTLEAMAETLFRQWFIEEAKEDWEEGTIADLVEFNPTRKLVKGTISPFLEMSNVSTSTYAPTYWYDRSYNSGTKFENGDTLLARITPCLENGKTAYVDFLRGNQVGWGSTEFIVMRSKIGLHPFFSYIIAKHQDFRDFAESCMSGSSGRQRVDVDNLKKYPMAIPDKVTVELFNDRIENIVSKMHNNNKQIQTLTQQRDGLLPKLMSGEVKI